MVRFGRRYRTGQVQGGAQPERENICCEMQARWHKIKEGNGTILCIGSYNSRPHFTCNMTAPMNNKRATSFNGMITYLSRSTPQLAHIVGLIRRMTQKDRVWEWDDRQKEAFQRIKQAISEAKVTGSLQFTTISRRSIWQQPGWNRCRTTSRRKAHRFSK